MVNTKSNTTYTKNRDLRSVGLKLNKGLNSNNRCGEHSKWVSRYRHPAGRWFVCALRLRSFAFCPPFDSRAAQPPPLFAARISLTWELLTSSCFTRGVIQLHRRRGSHVMVSRVRGLPTSASFVLSPQGWLWYANWGLSACRVMFPDVTWWKLSDDQIDTVIGILLPDKRRHGRRAGEWYQNT